MIGNPEKERREHPRTVQTFTVTYKLTLPLPVLMFAEAEEYPAVAMDVSEGGIGLDVDRPLPLNTFVNLRFQMANDVTTAENYRQRLFNVDGQIRHCTIRDEDLYRVGVLFRQITSEERDFIVTYIRDLSLEIR